MTESPKGQRYSKWSNRGIKANERISGRSQPPGGNPYSMGGTTGSGPLNAVVRH